AHDVEQLHGYALPAAQLFDQGDALLQRRALLLELVDFPNDRLEPPLLLMRTRDVGIDLRRPLLQPPVPVADAARGEHEDETAGERQPLGNVKRERLLLDLTLAAKKVDANHRSPTFRSARPTATAAVDALSAGSPSSFFASHVTARN